MRPCSGGASILFRKLPWGQTVAYVPKGPAVDWSDARADARSADDGAQCGR